MEANLSASYGLLSLVGTYLSLERSELRSPDKTAPLTRLFSEADIVKVLRHDSVVKKARKKGAAPQILEELTR